MATYRLFYGRVSSTDQNLELQLAQAAELNFDYIYAERISGRRRDRPEFANLIEQALALRQQGHQVECWVVEWTRWARNTIYSLEKVKELEAAGVVIMELTTRQPVSLNTASGLLSTGTKSLMAEYYSAELSERMRRSMAHRRNHNKPTSATITFGYRRSADKSKLEPGPDWHIARELIEQFMSGVTLTRLIAWLWQKHNIRRSRQGLLTWLKSPVLRGHTVYAGGADVRHSTHPPLVTEDEWRQISYRLELNRQLRGQNQNNTIYPVPNIVWCRECSRKCYSHINNKRKSYSNRYFVCDHAQRRGDCTNRNCISDRAIEAAIQEAIVEAADHIAIEMTQPSDLNPAIAALEAERATLEPLAHRPAIAEEIAAIDAEIANKKAGIHRMDASHTQALVKELAQLSSSDWDAIAPEERRAIYSELCQRVTILGKEVIEVKLKM